MTGNQGRRGLVIGFVASLAIHGIVAAIALRPREPVLHAALATGRDPLVATPRSQPPTPSLPAPPALPGLTSNDSTMQGRATGPGIALSTSRQGVGRTPEHGDEDAAAELRRGAQTSGDASRSSRARALATLQRLVDGSDASSIVQPIEKIASSLHSQAAMWVNHLWQSTVFAVAAGLLTIAFRRNRAHVRYWLWFSASVKFFVPFGLLVDLGRRLQWAPAVHRIAEQTLSLTMARISQPFPDSWRAGLWSVSATSDSPSWPELTILGVWACGFIGIALVRLHMWRRIRAAVRVSTPLEVRDAEIPANVEVRASRGLLEPGVVGFWRPILLLPAGIADDLTPAQLEAVLAHELCHIQRRDNLTAAIHMVVEAVFWFHPLVWWIGGRLVDERERACDEHVLRVLGDPRAYADGILNLCKRYVAARLACVSGVSGSDLTKRIEAIMRNQDREELGARRKLLLATAGVATVAVPILIGTLGAPLLRAQSPATTAQDLAFEAASVKPNRTAGPGRGGVGPQPGGRLTGNSVTAAELIQFAYELPDFQVAGGPNWLHSDRFAVVAKAAGDPPLAQKRLMLRKLLAERFRLAAHTEQRELPFYALMMARSDGRLGPQLRRSQEDCARADQPSLDVGIGPGPGPGNGPARCGFFGFAPGTNMPSGKGGLAFRGMTIAALAKTLVPMVHRSVSDQTGLTGYFDAEFDFMAELPPPPPPPGVPNPWGEFLSVFTVLPEQLGLKLDARRGPVEVLVIDRAEQPTPD